MFCVKCGQANLENCRFCPSCGHPVNNTLGEKETKQTSENSKKLPLFFKLGLFGILVGALFALLLLFSTDDPKQVINEQLKSLSLNQITEAYYAFTSKEFQKSDFFRGF